MYEELVPEIRDDPEKVGYANMTAAEVADVLNAKTKTKVIPAVVEPVVPMDKTVSISRAEEVGLPYVDVGNVLSALKILKVEKEK